MVNELQHSGSCNYHPLHLSLTFPLDCVPNPFINRISQLLPIVKRHCVFFLNLENSFQYFWNYTAFWKVNIYREYKTMTQPLSFPAVQSIISMNCIVTIGNALPRFHVWEALTRDGDHMVSQACSNNWVNYKRVLLIPSSFQGLNLYSADMKVGTFLISFYQHN
jgi:hypothetical protein